MFLTYKGGDAIKERVSDIVKKSEPYETVKSDDDITHTVSYCYILFFNIVVEN